jgi:anti-anti-sigma regulatory factor
VNAARLAAFAKSRGSGECNMTSETASTEGMSLSLESVLDMRAVIALKDTLLLGLAQNRKLAIDASAVGRMSTACVQVLTAFIIETQKANIPLAFTKTSVTFDAAFSNLGLASVLASVKPQVTA